MPTVCFDERGRYVQREYGRQRTFFGFLPGIAGPEGVPAWCNYTNRGQAVCSFGVQDRDHAILEFTAAQTAARQTPLTGFRTFLKTDGGVIEPFADGKGVMTLEMNALELAWEDGHFSVCVRYFTLPGARMAGLCRRLRVESRARRPVEAELLDGLAAIVPFGVSDEKLKMEAQLSTAWMRVDRPADNLPCFRVRTSMEDTARVSEVTGANFRLAFSEDGVYLPAVTDPELVFGWDTTLRRCAAFEENPLEELLERGQRGAGFLPCCMTAWEGVLHPGSTLEIWEFYGQTDEAARILPFCAEACSTRYFEEKDVRARTLPEEIAAPAACRTANRVFDGYVAQNFLDNVLRGGLPVHPRGRTEGPPVYLYSRRHGDPEREYNRFYMSREYFSQGDANFRDICQNRRSDVWICPAAGAFNLRLFFGLLQADGYNPLTLQPVTYRAREPERIAAAVEAEHRDAARALLRESFSPGGLAMAAQDAGIRDCMGFTARAVSEAEVEIHAEYQEGFWSDHWTYLPELLENVLAVFPDREETILWGEREYRWFRSPAAVRPLAERCCRTERGLRQYRFLRARTVTFPRERERGGREAVSTLGEKLLFLCAVKYATLDSSGAAVEMEGGKPGWCDALNGLPGLFGSSVPEACALLRLTDFLLARLAAFPTEVLLYAEIADLMREVHRLTQAPGGAFRKWVARCALRDRYRASVDGGFSGVRAGVPREELGQLLRGLASSLRNALRAVTEENGGICPSYFYYEATGVRETETGLLPDGLRRKTLPVFLEGPTRWLWAERDAACRERMAGAVKNSALYDRTLGMYKLCAPLTRMAPEIGRIRAFPAGWLENESIWLHMEYKYLLALLEAGLYERFLEDFRNVLVPFLSPEAYGRSTMENVSFLCSSAYADETCRGRGYAARLSGSTAEFISIWNRMLFGAQPFRMENGELTLRFDPLIPGELLRGDGTLYATFLGRVAVVFHAEGGTALYPGRCRAGRYRLETDGGTHWVRRAVLESAWATRVRAGGVRKMDVWFEPQKEGENNEG